MKTITINPAVINDIRMVAASKKKNMAEKCIGLNTRYHFNIDTLNSLPTNVQLINFANTLKTGVYSKEEIHQLLYVTDLPENISLIDEFLLDGLSQKIRNVTELKVGDIIYMKELKHPFLVINIYKSGLFKAVGLSSHPNTERTFEIKSRFLEKTSFVRLTVSINEIEEFKSKWIGSVPQSQVKLVKLWLKQNKL